MQNKIYNVIANGAKRSVRGAFPKGSNCKGLRLLHFVRNYIINMIRKRYIVVAKANDWIEKSVEVPDDFPDSLFPDINEGGMYQAADEAYNIFYGLLKTLNKESAPVAVIDILYDAIAGDAISPFTAAKRDLFNWWIIDVVPRAYCLKLPSNLYPRASAFASSGTHCH